MTIKPIETHYGGHRFRSRLEARWAVFFDELGVVWDYEPQGFDLGDAGLYLPDFWLEGNKCWFEVKGVPVEPNTPEEGKIRALRDESEAPVIVAYGRIGDVTHNIYAYDLAESSGGEYEGYGMWNRIAPDGSLIFQVGDRPGARDYYADPCFNKVVRWIEAIDEVYAAPPVWAAYMAARGARFEHGENGSRRR